MLLADILADMAGIYAFSPSSKQLKFFFSKIKLYSSVTLAYNVITKFREELSCQSLRILIRYLLLVQDLL